MKAFLTVSVCALALTGAAHAQTRAWMDRTQSAEARARAAVQAMTEDEKLSLVMGYTDPKTLAKQSDADVSPALKADVAAHARGAGRVRAGAGRRSATRVRSAAHRRGRARGRPGAAAHTSRVVAGSRGRARARARALSTAGAATPGGDAGR